jgi:hypothetical protein
MIHIGGFFTDRRGKNNLAGFYGCYGVVDPSQVYDTYANAEKNLAAYNDLEVSIVRPTGANSSNSEMNMSTRYYQP